MTFSHMANHYRKLLSVKPRVDTGVPKNAPSAISAKPSSKQFKGLTNGSTGKFVGDRERPSTGTVGRISSRTKTKSSRPKMASRMLEYEYHALSNGLMKSPNGSFNAGSSSDGYQVVFGPSSIKSSVDAMLSDPELDPDILEPKLSSISIGEKIRKFLDHIHAQETQSQHKIGGRPLLGSRERREPPITGHKSKEKLAAGSRHGNGTGRHSNCFTPFEVPENNGTKKRSVKSAPASHQPHLQTQKTQKQGPRSPLSAPQSRKNVNNVAKDSPPKLSTLIQNNKTKSKLNKNIASSSNNNTSSFQEMLTSLKHSINNDNNNNNTTAKSYSSTTKMSKIKSSAMSSALLSPRSVSVGTIRGSDELTEDYFLPSSSTVQRNTGTSTIQIDTGDMPTDWLKERVERGVVRINNAYFSLAPGTSTSSLGIAMHPNKDSSRDSAYGFSSGESRITTRESTPEKKSKSTIKDYNHHLTNSKSGTSSNGIGIGSRLNGHSYSSSNHSHHGAGSGAATGIGSSNNGKYKSSLSTVASSINQDRSSSNGHGVDLDVDIDSSGRSSASEKSILHPFPQRPSPSVEELLMDQKYMEFLTSVTDDIVLRGIYTNKGIKSILKSHLMKSNDLEMDKMLCLLEHLRMDMGVPKDDSLNHLDFGYGSVEYTARPYFYTPCQDNSKSSSPQQQLQLTVADRSMSEREHALDVDPANADFLPDPEDLQLVSLAGHSRPRRLSYTIERDDAGVEYSSSELHIT